MFYATDCNGQAIILPFFTKFYFFNRNENFGDICTDILKSFIDMFLSL